MTEDFQVWYQQHYPTDLADPDYRWHPANPVAVVHRQIRERAVIWALARTGIDLREADILEVGCGDGRFLRYLVELGATLERVRGIDLIADRVADGLAASPTMALSVGDAGEPLPWPDGSFDLVTQSVAFSSMPDLGTRRQAAAEMARVCRAGGSILWLDAVDPKPGGIPDGIPLADVLGLFPGFDLRASRPLYVRGLGRLARFGVLAEAVEALPWWPRTAVLAVLARPM